MHFSPEILRGIIKGKTRWDDNMTHIFAYYRELETVMFGGEDPNPEIA
jgi:hypothetical protein